MHGFIANNREELIARCKAKVAQRPHRAASAAQLANGIPMFLDQLMRTLKAEHDGQFGESARISGAAGGDVTALSEIGVSATAHGKQLLQLGFTVDQVVHDYGDLCQAITDLAVERDAPFAVDQFRTLNRCLDNAIADAVFEFSVEHQATVVRGRAAEENQRLGVLVHELRNFLQSATMALAALESGALPVGGATGGVLKRSLSGLSALLTRSLEDVRAASSEPVPTSVFSLASFIADASTVAALYAHARDCSLAVPAIDPVLGIAGNRDLLLGALVNLLQNAFKFTQAHTEVTLNAYATGARVVIEVKDHCGGLAHGIVDKMFRPFSQGGDNRSGLGLGLSIARRSVEADGGILSVRDVPGTGCVFTISLERHALG
jgi:signal transduction histidine kinase